IVARQSASGPGRRASVRRGPDVRSPLGAFRAGGVGGTRDVRGDLPDRRLAEHARFYARETKMLSGSARATRISDRCCKPVAGGTPPKCWELSGTGVVYRCEDAIRISLGSLHRLRELVDHGRARWIRIFTSPTTASNVSRSSLGGSVLRILPQKRRN